MSQWEVQPAYSQARPHDCYDIYEVGGDGLGIPGLDVRTRDIQQAQATIQRVREIERQMDEYSHRSGPCTGLNCGGCQAGRFSTALRRALTEALEGER